MGVPFARNARSRDLAEAVNDRAKRVSDGPEGIWNYAETFLLAPLRGLRLVSFKSVSLSLFDLASLDQNSGLDGRCFDCRTNRPLWRETVEIDVLKTVNSGITHPAHPQQHLHRRSNDVGANGRLVVVPVRETPAEFRNRGDIEFALHYIDERNFGSLSETIHEEVYHLLRLLVANIQGEYLTRVSQTK